MKIPFDKWTVYDYRRADPKDQLKYSIWRDKQRAKERLDYKRAAQRDNYRFNTNKDIINCVVCKKDISHRTASAIYCVGCAKMKQAANKRKTISISNELFNDLAKLKPKKDSWDTFLTKHFFNMGVD